MAASPADSFPQTVAIIEKGFSRGIHIGAQIYISRNGQPLLNAVFGESRPGVPMGMDTRMIWLSSGKPITAVALAQLWENKQLDWEQPVADFIPEFGANGKSAITIHHLLTHTGGFRSADTLWDRQGWQETIERICYAPLEPQWIPGEKAGYHLSGSWFILGEIIQRLSGLSFQDYVDLHVFAPCGMSQSWFAIPPSVYHALGTKIGIMQVIEKDQKKPHVFFDTEEGCAACRPGSSAHGPIQELGRFYEMLLAGGMGSNGRVLQESTVQLLTSPRRPSGMIDQTFKQKMDWGYGFIVNSPVEGFLTPYRFGPAASPQTFGHSGFQSSTGYCDPNRGLVVSWVFNGLPGEVEHQWRAREMNHAIFQDLENI